MSVLVWFVAAIKLGLPMSVMSWLMFNWLYGAGQMSRDAGHKAIRDRLQELKQTHKNNRSRSGNYLYRQWLFFGGGFYGLAVLWTLLVIEAGELIRFFTNFDMASLLANGIVALCINFVISQLGNMLVALMWFAYWPEDGGSAVVLAWVLMAYAGYLFGIHLARETESLHSYSAIVARLKLRRNQRAADDDNTPND